MESSMGERSGRPCSPYTRVGKSPTLPPAHPSREGGCGQNRVMHNAAAICTVNPKSPQHSHSERIVSSIPRRATWGTLFLTKPCAVAAVVLPGPGGGKWTCGAYGGGRPEALQPRRFCRRDGAEIAADGGVLILPSPRSAGDACHWGRLSRAGKRNRGLLWRRTGALCTTGLIESRHGGGKGHHAQYCTRFTPGEAAGFSGLIHSGTLYRTAGELV
jgi:hypothetical protein